MDRGGARRLSRAATVDDYRQLARKRLPSFLFHYVDGAAGDERTARANLSDLANVELRQRTMINVGSVSTETTVLGQAMKMPVGLGPVGLAGLMARRGEVQAFAAAREAGIPFCLSTLGVCSLEEVSEAAGEAPWFQLYHFRDKHVMAELLSRTREAGVRVLVLTVDVPVSGIRHRDRRHGLTGTIWDHAPQVLSRPRWCWDVAMNGRPLVFGSIARSVPSATKLGDFWGWLSRNFDPTLDLEAVAAVCESWQGPVIVKGIMSRHDARKALDAGASGIVVSNHGGRQLDGVSSSITVLQNIVSEVDGKVPVLFDGGIRSGLDVVRALTVGADMCLLGRAWTFALAAGGKAGLSQFLTDLQAQIANAMALTGAVRVGDLKIAPP
ncbi:L-lactate dehydrogenase (cytochrome) [Novosphingobium chloroacetimidivorans]|uniref:L-lactate dehydrogenase (Cytochrome) n=1 Tax=Novosphingobium chloroacetimidivorans TaxID=1428314 RepID=A0A7W7KCG6_9SPHN|nr:L-lactate dehydrogenase [Novosphingobium chloroacetimidivorans]MBB4860294.1 L-lactate dehydrogenase (cytochrome) [Novosphingobium chloroacetimidivorans]